MKSFSGMKARGVGLAFWALPRSGIGCNHETVALYSVSGSCRLLADVGQNSTAVLHSVSHSEEEMIVH